MPKLWIGYLLSAASLVGETKAISRHPEAFKGTGLIVPPLEMFLPVFVTRVYWFVCVYRYHKILAAVPRYVHPISPTKAVGFHFIPVFQIYWIFAWPIAIAKFVNGRARRILMHGWVIGLGMFFAALWSLAEPASGSLMLFTVTAYLAAILKRALTMPAIPRATQEGS